MRRSLKKLVFVEPKSTHLHIYSRVCIPRIGSVLLGTIMQAKGYDVRVYIEDIQAPDMNEVLSADLVAISAITSTAPQSYRLADKVRAAGGIAVMGGTHVSFLPEEGLEHADFVIRGEGEFAFQELEVHKGNMYTFFADDIFTANKKRCKDLLRGMIDRDLTPQWGAQVRTETVDDPELLQLMRDSNCFNVYVGFESINPRTLKLFQKKQDLGKIERSIERFHAHKIRIHGMFVVGSDEDDVETLDATAEFALKNDIDSIQFMILTPIPGSPDWEQLYDRGNKYVISKNWQFYDGHHVVHQPRRMSPYELQMGAINAMAKFYSWRGIANKILKGDKYYAAIRYFGKRMIRDWWKDDENRQHVEWLKAQLYSDAKELGQHALKRVGLPAILLQDSVGRLLQRFLGELGVTVVPLAEAAAEGAARARETVDCLITPIVKRAVKEREEFYTNLAAVNVLLQSRWEKLPRVSFPLLDRQGPVFEPFAKIGLLFTKNLDRIRDAYKTAGVQEGLWEAV